MSNISTVLCPVDFSDASTHALEHAKAVAGWYGARVVGLHVHTPLYLTVPGLALAGFPEEPQLEAEEVRGAEERLSACVQPVRDAGVGSSVLVQTGIPAAEIVEAANTTRADLIVMGTHGAGGFEHLVLGSVTEKVLRRAMCPVMTVPPRARATSRLPFKHVLCPVDFSEPSLAALKLALSMAEEADAALRVLHVLEWPIEDEPRTNRSFSVPEYGRLREQDAAERLKALLPEDAGNWCTATTSVVHGKAYREILGAATESGADLIVMGVHGRNALDLMLFGSTANQVVRRATCPVLTLRR